MNSKAHGRPAAGVVTFDGAPPPGFINFGVGQPSADLLSVGLAHAASDRFFASAEPFEFNYGTLQGDPRFLATLGDFISNQYGQPASPEGLFLTAGNSHALDFICTCFTRPGDTAFVEDPSYFLAFQILRDHGLDVVGIPLGPEGLDIDRLERELRRRRPKLLYTIPSYHNPTGRTLSREGRERLVALSREYDFMIAADEVYQMLYFGEPPPPALGTYAEQGNVLSMRSFSKIMAPAMRVGWIQTNAELMQTLLASGVINSGGSFNHFASHIVRHSIESGLLPEFMLRLRKTFRGRVAAMDAALRRHVGDLATWQVPRGGYFFWLEFGDDVDAAGLRARASEYRTGFQAGGVFSPEPGRFPHHIRLSFAHYTEPDIEEGIERFGRLLRARRKGTTP